MSHKTRKKLSKVADLLEHMANSIISALELVVIDCVYGKGKYRKRTPKPRAIVQKTVIYRQSAPRVVVVDKQR